MRTHFIELLEPRQMLSVTWINRGKGDNFDSAYKASAAVARQIVDAALADWSQALPKLNAKLRISAFDFEAGKRTQNTLGLTKGTTVRLDRDGAGHGWYFDPDLSDDSEFQSGGISSPFRASGSFKGGDFYSVAAHEIGHALGFLDTKSGYSERYGRTVYHDPHHSANSDDLMYPFLGTTPVRRLISPYDISHTSAGKLIKSPVAPRSFFTATATTGSPLLSLTWDRAGITGSLDIYRATGPGATWQAAGATLLTKTSSTQSSFVDMTAVPGQTYYYFVVPDSKTDAALGYAATASGVRGAGDPVSTSATPAADGVHLDWSVSPGLATLSVYRSTADAPTPAAAGATLIARFTPTVSAPLPTSWIDPGVDANVTYHYWLVASYDLSAGTGPLTDFTSPAATATPTSAVPSPVQILADSTSHFPGLRISGWVPVPGATSYDIYRSTTDAGSPQASGATVWQTAIHSPSDIVGDGTAEWGKGYYYWVVARFGTGPDAPTYAYPPGRGYIMKPDETNTASATFDQPVIQVSLAWDVYGNGAGVDHFDIYRSTTYAGTRQASGATLVGTLPGSASGDRSKFFDFGAPHDVNVYYWVTAVYSIFPDLTITRDLPPFAGSRVASPAVDYTPASSVLASKGTSRDSIEVSWQPVPGAGGYDIYATTDIFTPTLGRPSTPSLHVADPAATHATLGTNAFPGDYYNAAGPRTDTVYRIWVVATPGPGLAAAQDLGFDRGYLNAVTVSKGLPQGVRISVASNNYGYSFDFFRSTSPTASPTTGGLTYLGNHESGFIDTDTTPGVTYYYWVFHGPTGSLLAPVWGTDSGYRA